MNHSVQSDKFASNPSGVDEKTRIFRFFILNDFRIRERKLEIKELFKRIKGNK